MDVEAAGGQESETPDTLWDTIGYLPQKDERGLPL